VLCIQRRGADGKVQRRLAMSILGVDVSAGGREHRHNCRCRCVCIRAVTARAREVQRCSCRASGDVAVRCVGACTQAPPDRVRGARTRGREQARIGVTARDIRRRHTDSDSRAHA
jgi:hypothetical protein|tara:strand:+ start:1245 stop:1589 length:345 start_codon:yes stop_codon:yes gene_type:complete